MSSIVQVGYPVTEPVSLATQKLWMNVFDTRKDAIIQTLISGAREYFEDQLGIALASRNWIQFEDSLPFYPVVVLGNTIGAVAPIPSYGPPNVFPPLGWNPTFNGSEIRLLRGPVTAVDHVEYVDLAGNDQTLHPDSDFVVDVSSDPARIAPLPNKQWPQGMVGPGNVRIYFTAGKTTAATDTQNITDPNTPTPPDQLTDTYTESTGIPNKFIVGIMQLVQHWFENPGAVTSGAANAIPHSISTMIRSCRSQVQPRPERW